MARRHSGLGRGLDALIPMREEVEKAMQSAESEGMELLFSDDEEADEKPFSMKDPFSSAVQMPKKENVSRETSAKTVDISAVKQEEKAEVKRDQKADDTSESRKDAKSDLKPEETVKDSSESAIAEEKPVESRGSSADAADSGSLKDAVTVRISEVEPNRDQPRKVFDEEKLEELADSIKTFGLLQPILVQKRDGYYEIIAGERRWRAALKAGLKEIPVVVRDYTEKEILELSLIENIQREDLNPIEEAQAYKRLADEFGMGQAEISQRVSKSRSAVANALRLLKLDEQVQKMVIDGQLSMGHARALLSLEIPDEQIVTAKKVIEKQLSVRETEKLVKEILKNASESQKETERKDHQEEDPSIAIIYKQIEERLQQTLHTKVSIQRKRNGHGKLQIDFYSSDDLEKIIDRLTDR